MKKELIIALICAVFILFFSCKEKVQKTDIDSPVIKTIALSSIEESFTDTLYFKNPRIVALETTDESLISDITRMAIDDSTLFIYDDLSYKLFIFDINGKYISKIDHKGEGPNEYIQTNDFAIDTETKQIILLCAVPEKRMYFNYKGEFIKQEKNSKYFSLLAMEGKYIYFENASGNVDNQLYILDTKTSKIEENLKKINIKTRYFAKGNSINRSKNILYVRRFDNTLYELKSGKIVERYRIDFKEHSFPERFLTEVNDDVISRDSRENDYIYSMSNATENDRYLMFYTNRYPFLYDKRKDILTGYKKILHSRLKFVADYFFSYFLPVENTSMIACIFNEPGYIRGTAEWITEEPDDKEIKELRDNDPDLLKEIVDLGNKMTNENNPVLCIYSFKD